jgi:hypothetical protein
MNLEFLFAKILDIGVVTIYYFILGILISFAIDMYLGDFKEDDYKDTSSAFIFAEICAHLFILGVVSYVLRNIVERIPFPLEGFGGFTHYRLKERHGGIVLTFVLFFFQSNLNAKIMYLKRRLVG